MARPLGILCLLVVLELALFLRPETGTAQDWGGIRAANERSVVFIHSKRTRKDGTGVPDNSYGTGFIISEYGHVLTASHVVLKADASTLVETVGTTRSRHNPPYPFELIKRDEDIDIALLMFPDVDQTWRHVQFGDSRLVPKDAPLYALGFPGTLDLSPATGILSSKFGPKGNWQTTLGINRGQSGGPVFDINGKVIAIAAAGIDAYQQVAFAIPEKHALGLRQIATAGIKPEPPYIGVELASSGPNTVTRNTVTRKFLFYRAVDHTSQLSVREQYCLPPHFKIKDVKYHITTQNGPDTKVTSIAADRTERNCVVLTGFIKGAGVTKVGPIIVDHKGRGWLGVEMEVLGEPEMEKATRGER